MHLSCFRALEDLRDAVRNTLSLNDLPPMSDAARRALVARFDGDLADALRAADKALDDAVEAAETAAFDAEDTE